MVCLHSRGFVYFTDGCLADAHRLAPRRGNATAARPRSRASETRAARSRTKHRIGINHRQIRNAACEGRRAREAARASSWTRAARLDVRLNQAGGAGGRCARVRVPDWRQAIAIGLGGVFLGCRCALSEPLKRRDCIVDVSGLGATGAACTPPSASTGTKAAAPQSASLRALQVIVMPSRPSPPSAAPAPRLRRLSRAPATRAGRPGVRSQRLPIDAPEERTPMPNERDESPDRSASAGNEPSQRAWASGHGAISRRARGHRPRPGHGARLRAREAPRALSRAAGKRPRADGGALAVGPQGLQQTRCRTRQKGAFSTPRTPEWEGHCIMCFHS
jgi:hypothetical protein